jgi:DNA (cytosine-5)-methyltransferase 1
MSVGTLPLFVGDVKAQLSSLNFSIPDLITKDLKLGQTPAGGKRIRLSSNFLNLMGFESGTRTTISPSGQLNGLMITTDMAGKTKIYSRSYTQRKNNPIESLIDIQNQKLISDCIPSYAERVHIALRHGNINITPLANESFSIRRKLAHAANPFESFVAMTSGVDIKCMIETGFTIQGVLEYRPQEARDKNDLTETGALNVLANSSPKYLFNQDISKINWRQVEDYMKDDEPVSLLHVSLQCDEFGQSKDLKAKQRSVENLDTTVDLVYDGLRMVETLKPAVIMVENVPGFENSASGVLLTTKLRKWGYHVTQKVLDARDYSGLTSRKRFYLIASVWPGLELAPEHEAKRTDLWDIINANLNDCRDITHTKTVHLGIEVGRSRIITKDSSFAPTVMKSQNRQAKDSIYIEKDGRYFMPSEKLLRELNSIPESFDLNSCSSTIASEIIGQSIEYPMHHAILKSVYDHIRANTIGAIIKFGNG